MKKNHEVFFALLAKVKETQFPIIVEGKKDMAALRSLGLTNTIVTLNSKPLFSIVEEVATKYRDAIILTDLDEEGKKLYGSLHRGLNHYGVRIHNEIRHFLLRHTSLRQIEGLSTYYQE
ncbi:toprim domain-containing protein [Candidatus Woesearchaeota archaeon]|nr:toprim domain-containing protein [Candidatus Woesearchaeota archaeon]